MLREKIFVSFYQSGSNKLIAACEIPTKELPETFAIDTQMHVGGQSFIIADAKPHNKKDFLQSGKLDIFLAEIKSMNPQEILYSLPTINDEITPYEKTDNVENVLIIAEDDVRQVEFVASKFTREINHELLAIRNIYDSTQEQAGFRTIHLRQQIKKPFESKNLKLETIKELFVVDHSYRGVGYRSYIGVIPNSFAFVSKDKATFWGETTNGQVCFLNLIFNSHITSSFADKMDQFLSKNDLYLIDWVRLIIIGKDRNSFGSFSKEKN